MKEKKWKTRRKNKKYGINRNKWKDNDREYGRRKTKKFELVELGKDPWMINIYDLSSKTLVIS